MARRIRYVPNHKSFGEFILSDQVRDAVSEVAHDIADLARTRAKKKTGAYAEGFKVNREAGAVTVAGNPRVNVEVFNEDPAAGPEEFGGKRNARHRTLGRAGAAFGDFKPDGGLDA